MISGKTFCVRTIPQRFTIECQRPEKASKVKAPVFRPLGRQQWVRDVGIAEPGRDYFSSNRYLIEPLGPGAHGHDVKNQLYCRQ